MKVYSILGGVPFDSCPAQGAAYAEARLAPRYMEGPMERPVREHLLAEAVLG